MKKIQITFFFLLAGIVSFAQVPGFTLGPKIGATLSMYNMDSDVFDEETKSSMHWGAFVRFGDNVYIQPEMLFMNRSGLIKSLIDDNEETIKLRTIDVPVLLGVKVADLKFTNVRIFAGPVASIVVNKEIETDAIDAQFTKDELRSANWGIQFGAGADLLMFTIDLRYELGMGDYSEIDETSLKNNLVTLSVGWKIL